MAYRKARLRSMSPVTRKVARLIGEQVSVARRFKTLIPEIQSLETDSRALANAKQGVNLPAEDWENIYHYLEIWLADTKLMTLAPRHKASFERLHAQLKARPL